MAAHSNVIGGSTARRVIHCPASVPELMLLPIDETSSPYADEGTALHTCMEMILRDGLEPVELAGRAIKVKGGATITIDEEHVGLLQACLDKVDAIIAEVGEEPEIYLEVRGEFPGIKGGFGTCDLVLVFKQKRKVVLVDYKFGGGVPVKAVYYDDNGDGEVNEQLMFYLVCAGWTLSKAFEGIDDFDLWILQPRVEDGFTCADKVTREEIGEFVEKCLKAVSEAQSKQPLDKIRRLRGDWCRFAACKVNCPKHTGPMIDLVKLPSLPAIATATDAKGKVTKLAKLPAVQPVDYGARLAAGLDLLALIEDVAGEYKSQAHAYLEAGGVIPGYKLVDKRATRKWIDEVAAADWLYSKGVPLSQVHEPETTISVAAAEKIFKARKIAEELTPEAQPKMISKISSGTTMVPDSDSRPVAGVDQEARIAAFTKAIGR